MRRAFEMAAVGVVAAVAAWAAAPIPPPPKSYFNDYAGLVSPEAARHFEAKLREFERGSSNQVVVAIFPELPSPSMEDFTVRTAQAWRVGQKKLDTGVVLFVFVKDRKMRLEVGYGLEGALPDATAKRIIDGAITPAFKGGAYAAGLEAGIDAIIAVTRGEYRPPPSRSAPSPSPPPWDLPRLIAFFVIGLSCLAVTFAVIWSIVEARATGWGSGGGSWSSSDWSGCSSSSSSSGSSSSSDFSGGGGSFGGGGASGSW